MAETPGFDERAIEKLSGLDKHISVLFECKPLPESEISKLCEQVSPTSTQYTESRATSDTTAFRIE